MGPSDCLRDGTTHNRTAGSPAALPRVVGWLGCHLQSIDRKRKTQIDWHALRPACAAAFPLRPVLVPQDEVNRKGTLARPLRALQPNNVLDRDSRNPNPKALVNRQRSAESAHPEGVERPKGATLTVAPLCNPAVPDSVPCKSIRPGIGLIDQTLTTAFTRDARRDILRATVFLCSTPLVTPRASSGWAAFNAA
jgi:hypothetical protein